MSYRLCECPARARTLRASVVGIAPDWLGDARKAAGGLTEMGSLGFHSWFNGEKVSFGCVHLLWHPRAVLDFADGETATRSAPARGELFPVLPKAKWASASNPRGVPRGSSAPEVMRDHLLREYIDWHLFTLCQLFPKPVTQ